VFTGAAGRAAGLPPYLVAAAAMQSRAFPAFTYDPSAGPDWASRFTLEDNPQPDLDWPVAHFAYEDEAHQRVAEDVAFTFADFVACDPRYAKHLAGVPRALWNGSLVTVRESLAHEVNGFPDKVPYLMMVDRNEALRKVIVDDKLVMAAQRCREMWHSLQELGGIRNSYAERVLAREKQAWEEQKQREIEALKREVRPAPAAALAVAPGAAAAAPSAAPAAAPAPAVAVAPQPAPPVSAPAAEEPKSDEAYIETPRCTTCNECTLINDRMFAYDDNKQAYIKDVTAGTYRQLVEAAESCQVSIIHPGKPRDPKEPGLEDLLKRAEPFL
jgi:ferredoxin